MYFSNNLKSFCRKRNTFNCAGIRARVFRFPVDCSNQLSDIGVHHDFLTGKPRYIVLRHFNNFTIVIVELKCHRLHYQDTSLGIR